MRVSSFAEDDLRRASVFFPAVGVLVAAAGVIVRIGLERLLGVAPATILAVAAMVAVTGAFHEDGLADTFDGIWGGATPERRVEIMRDSRVGTYGLCALVIVLLLRVTLLMQLDWTWFGRAAVAGAVIGRASGVLLAGSLRPVSDQGLGAKVIGPPDAATVVVVALSGVAAGVVGGGWWFAAVLAPAALAIVGMRALANARLRGLTGDVLGAVNQLADLGAIAAVVAITSFCR